MDGPQPAQHDEEMARALSLWVVLAKAFNAVAQRMTDDIRGRGFNNPTEWAVLEYLYHKGRQPLGKIGQHILLTSGSVTYVVDSLERQGLLKRCPCPEDRRVIYGELTEEGRELVRREFPGHAAAVYRVMGALTPQEQEEMEQLLKKLGRSAAADTTRE